MKLLLGSHRRGEGIPLPLASLIELDSEVGQGDVGELFSERYTFGGQKPTTATHFRGDRKLEERESRIFK